MASRRSPKRASASSRHRSANNNNAAKAQQPSAPASHQHMPESQDRQQLMSIFGTFPSEAELESQAAAVAAAAEATDHLMSQGVGTGVATDGSPGSSSYNHRTMEFLSPSPPSSANASAASSEQLPENVQFSMSGTARQQQQQHFQAGSAQNDRQQRKVVAAYNNQFAHLLGKPVQNVTPSGNLESPSVSLISGSSFNSPRTITLDDLQQSSRMQPRRTHHNNISSSGNTDEARHTASQLLKTAASKGKWSQHTTPSPHTTALNAERDSGVFGGQSFTFVTPPNVSTGGTPQPLSGFEPIEELDEDVSWSQAVARSQGVTQLAIERQPMPQFDDSGDENNSYDDMADNRDYSPRPRYEVHVPAPETLARTPTLITRSPTPTRMLEQQKQRPRTPSQLSSASPLASQSRRPRATTMLAGDQQVTYGNAIGRKSAGGSSSGGGINVNSSSRETYSTHSRSRSFGSTSTEPITLQQLQSQRIRLQQQQQHYTQHRDTPRDELSVSLIPPPPEGGALQFLNPFVGRSSGSAGDMPGLDPSEGMPEYLYERQDPQYETADSATRTRIRNRKQRNPSSVMSAGASPIYTRESVYTPSNAGSNMTYEMTYLGMHRTMTASRANTSMVTSEYSTGGLNRGDSRRRSSSVASDRRQQADIVIAAQAELGSSPLPLSTEELRREQRGQMHKRSESVGSSRVSSIRDEIEQRQAALAQESAKEAWGMLRQKSSLSQRNNQPAQSATHTAKTPPVLERWEHARRKTEGKVVYSSPSASSSSSVAAGVVSAAAVAMTSHSQKVAQIRERIEEWQQRTETPEPSLTTMPAITGSNISMQDRSRESAATGSSAATTARGAQQNVGEIESVAASAAPSKAAVSPESASSQPAARLVPLTPVLGHRARQEPPSGKHAQAPLERVQALARSNTQASHDSKYSEGTTQSSNVPPSLFGSDKSTFSTPLLSGLPHATVPSNVPSLRTASTAKTMQRQPLNVDPTDDHSSMFLGSVISAVSSPVSVGGHKRESLVVDAHSASSELLQNVQHVKTASPTVLHAASAASSVSLSSSGISMSQIGEPSIVAKEPRVTTQSVMDSPTANIPSFIGSEERRSWAILYPTDRPPLSNPSNESMGSAESREWDEKLRRRAKSIATQLDINASASDDIRFRPQITASPVHATDPKTSGGLDLTPPVSEEFRKERKFSALATLEGAKARQQKSPRSRKNRQNRDPLRSGPPSPTVEYPVSDFAQLPQPNMQSKFSLSDSSKRTSDLSEASDNDLSGGLPAVLAASSASSSSGIDRAEQGILQNKQYNYEQLLLSEIATPVANIPRPPSQRMGRHGSSPLNPYNASPTMTASLGSVVPSLPPLPAQPAAQNSAESVPPPLQPAGLFDRLAGTMRRKDRASDGAQGISTNDPLVLVSAQTPLPQRWWRNIKESMYAPIPPLHSGQSQQHQVQSATVAAIPAVDDAAVEQLPGRPARRHSFSGSTNIEQNKITAALSPRENVRRKMTLGDRVRGMLRGKRGALPATILGAVTVASAAAAAGSGSVTSVAGPTSEHSMYMPDPAGKLNLRIANVPSSSIPRTNPEWAETNPFNSQKLPRRRASFDTLSVHEMAEADRQSMYNRLNHLLNPHIAHAGQAGAGIDVLASGSHFSLAQSPNLGHVPLAQPFSSSGKFSFTASSQVSVPDSANGRTPKPLPVTPRRKSQAQDEAAPMQSVFTFPSRQEMVQKNSQPLVSPSPVFNVTNSATGGDVLANGEGKQQRQQPAKYDRITGLPITIATAAPVSSTGNLAVSRQEMIQRPPPMISDSVPFSPGSGNVPFSPGNNNLYVNTAEVIRPHQLVTIPSQQLTIQQQSEDQSQVSANVQKRPSLFRRLTSGWRKPVPTVPNRPTMAGQLEPIAEANADYAQNTHGGAMGTMATAAGVVAATGIISHMLQPATHGNASATAPNNNQGYPANNSDPNGANMNTNPIVNVYTASPQQYSQGHVQPQTQQQQQMSYQPGVMSALSPTMYSQDPNMRPQQPGNMMNMQTPMPGQTQFSANVYQPGPDQPYIQPQVQYSGDSYAPAPHHITQPMAAAAAQGSSSSKLMSVMAGIPVLGALFAKKTPPANANVLPPSGGFNPALVGSQPSVAENYGQPPFRPNTSMSYTTSYVGGASPLPDSKPEGFGSIIGKAMEKFHWVQIPLMTYALRESVRRNIAPLVGRYALRYPLVEAEETAAIRAAAEQVKKSNTVQAGALRALDAKEFRHAAPGLRYSALDQRLENTYVPRFSRLRKYRRAPEVWDDEDAHNIAKRVYSRMRATQQSMNGHERMRVARSLNRANSARRSSEAVLRGGGGHMHRDIERGELSVDGHQGSGERGLGDAESSAAAGGPGGQLLAHHIGAYLVGLCSRNQQRKQVQQQNSASFGPSPSRRGLQRQSQPQQRAACVSPGNKGLSRIIDSDVEIDVNVQDDLIRVSVHDSVAHNLHAGAHTNGNAYSNADADSDHGSDLLSLRREPTVDQRYNEELRDITIDYTDHENDGGYYEKEDELRPVNGSANVRSGGLRQRFFGGRRTEQPAAAEVPAQARGSGSAAEQAPAPVPVPNSSHDQEKSSSNPPMFPPFSHLPPRVVDQIMHRVGEPRVFIGSASSQLVPPNNGLGPGDGIFGDASPYRTGTEWSFAESIKFSSPYPTATEQVKNKSVWARINGGDNNGSKTTRKLLAKPRSNEIARWPVHVEIIRDYLQIIALVLGSCGFLKSPLDSPIGKRWPWMLVAGVPETLGLLWADLSTTTGKSIGFLIFLGAIAAVALSMWSYAIYLERPPPPRAPGASHNEAADKQSGRDRAKQESEANDGGQITFEEELSVVPSRFNIFGRMFGRVPKRQRMHIIYFVLTTLYIPVVKLCLEAIVWSQGYWAVPNPFRTSDDPVWNLADSDSSQRNPEKFCYTTTMRNGSFNGAFVVLPLAVLLFIVLGMVLPVQVYKLTKRHMPRVPGWLDGKTPGYRLPPAKQASRPTSALAAAAAAPSRANSRASRGVTIDPPARGGTRSAADGDLTRDDPNPMLNANALLQGIDKLGIMNPEVFGNLAMLYGLVNNAGGIGGIGGPNGDVSGLINGVWGHVQKWLARPGGSVNSDPYLGMEKDEAYQARLRDMKESHRNRHLATVQYRRALDSDTADYRFLYVANYPVHASDPARMLLWKLLMVVVAVVLAKDNCWAKSRTRHSLDAGRCAALLLVALLMLRSHHSHRPFFDPTANLAGLLMRIGVLAAVVFAFPLFLLEDPLSMTHMGLCVTLVMANLLVLLALLWLLSNALPRFQVVVRGASQPLTLSPGILVATSPYDPRLRRLLIERVWQDTWSAILLASRDFRLLPNHRIAFCKTRAHPPYMVNYIGFAAERHLENLHLYDAIGRHAYCQAVQIERLNDQRSGLMDEIARGFTGPDMYFNPYTAAHSGINPVGMGSAVGTSTNFYGIGRSEVQTWFGRSYILHFPFMVCMVYDELPDVVVPISDEAFLRLYLQQNRDDPSVLARRNVRRRLRALDGQHVTLTYIENAGPNGTHHRYCLPPFASENEAYLAQFAGRRRILYRGVVTIKQHANSAVGGSNSSGAGRFAAANVAPGFECSLALTEEMIVDNEHLVNNLSREHNAFRLAFWQTGHAPDSVMLVRTNITQQSRRALRLNENNRHLLGITPLFDETTELRALFDENSETIDARLEAVNALLDQHMVESHASFVRKRTGLTPSFHIDVFAPGPESFHVQQMAQQAAQNPNAPQPIIPATPALFGGNPALNGQWHNDEHGRLSYIPTMEQLAERLERFEENSYMRDLLVDHRDDITLLYERLRTLVPSESNDPVKFAWYIFWDDLHRRYGKPARQGGVKQMREYDVDFNPLYPQALPYYPMPRHRLERFLFERGLWKPLKMNGSGGSGSGRGLGFSSWLPWGNSNGGSGRRQNGAAAMAGEFDLDPMPVPEYVPGVARASFVGNGIATEAHLWRAGEEFDSFGDAPFARGVPATGFIHSGLLNRLYAWLDVIAYGTSR